MKQDFVLIVGCALIVLVAAAWIDLQTGEAAEEVAEQIEPKLVQRIYRSEFLNWLTEFEAWERGGKAGPMPRLPIEEPASAPELNPHEPTP